MAPYAIVIAPEVNDHLDAIDNKHHSLIQEKIDEQLRFEPHLETRNRKPLRAPAPFAAEWEIRFGPANRFRVLYRIIEEDRSVYVLAVGEKWKDRVLIGGKEVEL